MGKWIKPLKNVGIISGILLVWYIFSRHSSPLFLPKPEAVWDQIRQLSRDGLLIDSAKKSFSRITIAAVLASAVSVPIGLFVANYKWVDALITPLTNSIRYIPVTVLYAPFIMWFGIEETMKVAFLFAATIFYLLPAVIMCVKETNRELVDTAYTMGMSKFQLMFNVLLPYSLPSMCQNFLVMYGIGWTYIIIVEATNAQLGLGHIIHAGLARGRTDMVFASVIIIVLISFLFDFIGNLVVRRVFKWKFAREVGD